jgi:hypothetical protein
MSENEHVAAIKRETYWIRSRYSGHQELAFRANQVDEHTDALAAQLAEARAGRRGAHMRELERRISLAVLALEFERELQGWDENSALDSAYRALVGDLPDMEENKHER